MLVIVKLHPEIFVKSRSLRKRHLKLLVGNIRQVMKRHDDNGELAETHERPIDWCKHL